MGRKKSQKVGNRYFYGFALVICRQMDALLKIQMNDKDIWTGRQGQGQLDIAKPNAFGGDEREGGFSGLIDVQLGANDQPVNDYLLRQTGGLTSALRGVVSMIFRRPYVSANTARLPSLKVLVTNVDGVHRGWQVATSRIDPQSLIDKNAFYICLDGDRSGNVTSFANHVAAVAAFVRSLKGNGWTNSFYVFFAQWSGNETTQRLHISSDAEYESLAVWIESRTRDNINSWVNNINLSAASAFYAAHDGSRLSFIQAILSKLKKEDQETKGRRLILVANSSGLRDDTIYINPFNAALAGLGNPEVICIGGVTNTTGGYIDQRGDLLFLNNQVDVSTVDDIPWMAPVVGGGSPTPSTDAVAHYTKGFLDWVDMNPAHIIRALWTDPMRGGTVSDADIGDSFAEAAALFYEEGFGLSAKFRGLDEADTDRKEVERHVDAVSYRSNRTGKIELVPIRDDYDVNNLVVLDSSIVMDWSGLSRPRPSEVPNQVTVTYTKRNGEIGSVTRTNVAGVRRLGRVVKAAPIAYPFVTTEELAVRLALRDLRTITSAVLAGTIPLRYLPAELEVGSVCLINEPSLNYNNIVMRLGETRIGKADDATAFVTISEDKFVQTQAIELVQTTAVDPSLPVSMLFRLVTEASYYQLVAQQSQEVLDLELVDEPDGGRLIATGAKANSYQLEATLATSTGGDWVDQGLVDFEPYGVLVNNLSPDPTETTFLVYENDSVDEISAGDLARLGTEVIRIDDLVDQLDGTILVSVGRGCLDGPPVEHLAGAAFIVSSVVEPLEESFIAGQSIDVKMLSRTGSGALSLSDAVTDTVTFASRAYRPYNVGKLQAGGSYFPTGIFTGSVSVTWAHRDRTFQTTPDVADYTAASIGPEAGTSYVPIRQIYTQWADVFALSDLFAVADIFEDPTPVSAQEYTALVANETTYAFSADDDSDVFAPPNAADIFDQTDLFLNAFTSNLSRLGLAIRTERDGYENLITPTVKVKPLLPVSLFTATQDGP